VLLLFALLIIYFNGAVLMRARTMRRIWLSGEAAQQNRL
jgi:hypothetical protein